MAAADYRLMTEATGQRIAAALEALSGTGAAAAAARTNLDVYSKGETDNAIAQSTANLQGLTVYNMSQSGSEETAKPWLVIKRLIGSIPTGSNLVGRINAGSVYNYYGFKYNNSYASFIVDYYSRTNGPYKVTLRDGSWSYATINVGAYTDF